MEGARFLGSTCKKKICQGAKGNGGGQVFGVDLQRKLARGERKGRALGFWGHLGKKGC